ncbi:non-heme iron oxygenase ferredoxin subunit [Brevundimonas sp. LPMIX5]|nr:non-heme iron oxygenase ferredoxin subunit [Brevundimonas sp. LPMIX5]
MTNYGRISSVSALTRLCSVDDLSPGEMQLIELEGMDPLLLCNSEGSFHLVDDECTHAIASLSEGRLEGHTVFCPLHGGSFDVRSGKALTLPCKQALRTFPIVVEDGAVFLRRG